MNTGMWRSAVASVGRMYPFWSGCGTLANHPVMDIVAPASAEILWARSPGGMVQVPLDDYVGRAVYYFGDLDPKITWIIKRLLRPGDQVLDIGANLGVVTLWMSKLVAERGTVHAFEPNPMLCGMIQTALARNHAANVTLHQHALGDASGKLVLHVPDGNCGAASFIRGQSRPGHAHEVPVMKLDEIVLGKGASEIALVKIDVEGFELQVLTGASRVLRELRPAAILFESNEESTHKTMGPVMRFLREFDYEFVGVPHCMARMRTSLLNFDSAEPIQGHDFVAAPRGEPFSRLCRRLRAS
jgi:FkbM family methyltransferase